MVPPKILFTGGIGDFIALDCYMPESLKQSVETFYLATPRCDDLKEVIEAISYPKLKSVEIIWRDFIEEEPCCFFLMHAFDHLTRVEQKSADFLFAEGVEDWSIAVKFREIRQGYYSFGKSSTLDKQLAELPLLPDRYAVIQPSSKDNFQKREFSPQDWQAVNTWLDDLDLQGVAIGKEGDVPDGFIDLTGQTSIIEAIEITKRAEAFAGVDSCLSVVAAKCLPIERIKVKSDNVHLLQWCDIYYAPHDMVPAWNTAHNGAALMAIMQHLSK